MAPVAATGSTRSSCRETAPADVTGSIRQSCSRHATVPAAVTGSPCRNRSLHATASVAAPSSTRRSCSATAFAAATGLDRSSCRATAPVAATGSPRRSCCRPVTASVAATGLDRCRLGAPYAARHAAARTLRLSGERARPRARQRASQRYGSLRESRGREGRGGTVAHLPSPSLGRFRQVTRAFGENGTAAPRMTSRFHVLSSYGYGGCDRPALGRMLSRSGLPSRGRRAQSAHGVGPPPRGAVRTFPAGAG